MKRVSATIMGGGPEGRPEGQTDEGLPFGLDPEYDGARKEDDPRVGGSHLLTTSEILTDRFRRDISTPGEGVLSSGDNDRDAATG